MKLNVAVWWMSLQLCIQSPGIGVGCFMIFPKLFKAGN